MAFAAQARDGRDRGLPAPFPDLDHQRDIRAARHVLEREVSVNVGQRRRDRAARSYRATAVTARSGGDRIESARRNVDDGVVDRELARGIVHGPRDRRLRASRALVDHAQRRSALASSRARTDVVGGALRVARFTGTSGLTVQEAAAAVSDRAAVEASVRRGARPGRAVGRVVTDVRHVPAATNARGALTALEHAAAAVTDPSAQRGPGRAAGGVRHAIRWDAHVADAAETVAARWTLLPSTAAVADEPAKVRATAATADLRAVGPAHADALLTAPAGQTLTLATVRLSTAQVADHTAVAPAFRIAARLVTRRGVAFPAVDRDDGTARAARAAASAGAAPFRRCPSPPFAPLFCPGEQLAKTAAACPSPPRTITQNHERTGAVILELLASIETVP